MLTQAALQTLLEALPLDQLDIYVEEERPGRFLASVTSPDFEGKNEAERQEVVWKYLLENVADTSAISYVATVAPSDDVEEVPGAGVSHAG